MKLFGNLVYVYRHRPYISSRVTWEANEYPPQMSFSMRHLPLLWPLLNDASVYRGIQMQRLVPWMTQCFLIVYNPVISTQKPCHINFYSGTCRKFSRETILMKRIPNILWNILIVMMCLAATYLVLSKSIYRLKLN